MKKALQHIMKADKIFLTTHENTDGDDLGSLLALKRALHKLDKHMHAAVSKGVPKQLKFLPRSHEVSDSVPQADYDLIITFGCGNIQRTNFPDLYNLSVPIINFDHHPDNKMFGTVNVVEPSTSSVAEMMFHFFNVCNLSIDKDMATCLLTGIFTDTGGFKHANTTSSALQATSDLIKKGARVDHIAHQTMSHNTLSTVNVWAKALENTRFDDQNKIVFSVLTAEDLAEVDASHEDLSGIASFLITMPEAKLSMFLRQDGEVVRGSLRSEPDRGVDVNKIAASFGGGGHKLASGFKVKGKLVKSGNGWKII